MIPPADHYQALLDQVRVWGQVEDWFMTESLDGFRRTHGRSWAWLYDSLERAVNEGHVTRRSRGQWGIVKVPVSADCQESRDSDTDSLSRDPAGG